MTAVQNLAVVAFAYAALQFLYSGKSIFSACIFSWMAAFTQSNGILIIPLGFILDLMMPDPDGFKVCRMLRQTPRFIFTPIIIVTALDDSDSKVVAFGAGADDYLTKPFHIDELSQRVKDLLGRTE